MAGINELLDVIRFGVSLGNAMGNALQDKKFNLADLVFFVDSITKMPAAISGIEQVPAQLKDLDEEEKKVILETISKEFDIPQDNVEPIVEDALKIALAILVFLNKHFI